MNICAVCTRTYVPVCRYRLSSGSGDTSSSEEDRYDRKEAKIYGNSRVSSSSHSSSSSKAPNTTAKVPATEGNNSYCIGMGNYSINCENCDNLAYCNRIVTIFLASNNQKSQ